MRSRATLALSLMLSGASVATAFDATFGTTVPLAGARTEVICSSERRNTFVAKVNDRGGTPLSWSDQETLTATVTITAADAKGASNAKLVFSKCERTGETAAKKPKTTVPAYSARTYDVGRRANAYVVKGVALSLTADEKRATGLIVSGVIEPAPLGTLLAGKTLKEGDRVDVPVAVAAKLFAFHWPATEVKSCTLTLDSERQEGANEVAVFKAVIKLRDKPESKDESEMASELTGEIVVRKDSSRILSMSLTGPVKCDITESEGALQVGVEIRGEWTVRYTVKA